MESGVPARRLTCKDLQPRTEEARDKPKQSLLPATGRAEPLAGHRVNEIQKKSVSTARSEEAALLSEPNT